MTPDAITILGAGVAGLALARGLALRGWDVTVLEQAGALTDIGAGLQISPNGAAVLRALDVDLRTSLRGKAVELRGRRGGLVLQLDVSDQSYHMIHRADLIALLAEAAVDAGARIVLGHRGGNEAGLLVGADGLHSGVRVALNGPSPAFFTNHVAWRATIPCEGDPAVAEIHMGHGRHLVSYPLRGGTLRNIVAVEERRTWAEESWTLRDESRDLQAVFAGFSPRVRSWLDQVERPWLWGLFRHPVAERWHDDRRVILGDAAHPTLPFMAQGANMALEDAWVLVKALATEPDFLTAAAAYQAARQDRVRRVVRTANGNARLYHLPPPVSNVVHLAMRLGGMVAPSAPLKRFDWIYRHDVTR